jgi:hypothetical protein
MTPQERRDLISTYLLLRARLDNFRQQDNAILFDAGNPPERDHERELILTSMRRTLGEMQVIEQRLRLAGEYA